MHCIFMFYAHRVLTFWKHCGNIIEKVNANLEQYFRSADSTVRKQKKRMAMIALHVTCIVTGF